MYGCKATIRLLLLIFLSFVQVMGFKNLDAQESFLVLKGLQEKKDEPKEAIKTFKSLYELTQKSEYLKESVQLAYVYRDNLLHELITVNDKNLSNDDVYSKIKIAYLVENKKFNEAILLAKNNLKTNENAKNYSILAITQEQLNLNDEALKNYKKAYELDANEINLLTIVEIYINKFNDKDSAIKELENYKTLKGCTIKICSTLIELYRQDNNYKKIIEIYENLYNQTKKIAFLEDIVNFYIYSKDYNNAILILEKYNFNNKLLVEIYGVLGKYDLAIKKANDSYESSKDLEYLAMKAIYLYEKYSLENLDKKYDTKIAQIIENFERSALFLDNAVYENYYGYLLIDHDIDIKKGLELVKKALAKEPNYPYYLDSLAWGYYKLNDCKKADEIMKKIKDKEFLENEEGKLHINAIEKCLKDKK